LARYSKAAQSVDRPIAGWLQDLKDRGLLGLDQEELTHFRGGRLKRLTENGGEIIQGLLA